MEGCEEDSVSRQFNKKAPTGPLTIVNSREDAVEMDKRTYVRERMQEIRATAGY